MIDAWCMSTPVVVEDLVNAMRSDPIVSVTLEPKFKLIH